MMKKSLFALVLITAVAAGAAERIKHRLDEPTLSTLGNNQEAMLLEWSHPVDPPELKPGVKREIVRVSYIVDETGAVTVPEVMRGDERFHAAALAAIKLWKYKPATEDGKNVPRGFEVDFEFTPNGPPETTSQFSSPYKVHSPKRLHPEERRAPDPVYPKHLEKRQLFGEVELTLAINKLGRVEAVEVVRATHADFLSAAFTAFEQWEFRPAMVGRLPDKGEQLAVMRFEVMDGETNRPLKADWLENCGVTIRDPAAPKSAEYFDEIPVAQSIVDPVYPHDLLTKSVEGTARVNFSVNKEGEVVDITVVEATEPDFGAALAAAMAAWKFKPLYHLGEKAWVDFSILWKFAKPSEENTGPESLAALLTNENRVKARELDRPLAPLYLLAAVYPKALKETKQVGQANIEITINQSGRVCWPRIVSATQPEFGWAAATAVSRWYFETPLKGGKPVEVRAVIPVNFKPE